MWTLLVYWKQSKVSSMSKIQKSTRSVLYTWQSEFFNLTSQESRLNKAYLEKFQALIDMLEDIWRRIGNNTSLIYSVCHQYGLTPSTMNTLNEATKTRFKKDAKEWYYAIKFPLGSNCCRCGRLIEDLEDQFLYGSEKYTKTLVVAYNLIRNRKTYQLPG